MQTTQQRINALDTVSKWEQKWSAMHMPKRERLEDKWWRRRLVIERVNRCAQWGIMIFTHSASTRIWGYWHLMAAFPCLLKKLRSILLCLTRSYIIFMYTSNAVHFSYYKNSVTAIISTVCIQIQCWFAETLNNLFICIYFHEFIPQQKLMSTEIISETHYFIYQST